MIAKVLVSSKPPTVGLRPIGDSLVIKDWHPQRTNTHRYPTEGCHGAPLERECTTCDNGMIHDYGGPFDCGYCGGTGRVRVDHPNRTDGP